MRLVLQAVKRRMHQAPFAKLPIDPNLLRHFHAQFDMNNSFHASLWCSFLLAFFAFLRKSNVVPRSLAAYDSLKHLSRSNIVRTGYGLSLTLNWSKTNQYHERNLEIPIAEIQGDILDPVRAFENMCRLAPASAQSPAFSFCNASGALHVYDYLCTVLKGAVGLYQETGSGSVPLWRPFLSQGWMFMGIQSRCSSGTAQIPW